MFRPLAYSLPSFPGFDSPKTYAAWPVWRDSTTEEVKFTPLPKRQVARTCLQISAGSVGW